MKETLYFILFCFVGGFILMGSSNGPAAVQETDRTGSPLASGYCGNAGCHDDGAFSPEIEIKLEDEGSMEVLEYIPGTTYTVKVKIKADGAPAGYGFQSVVLDTTNANAGSFGMAGSGIQVITLDNRDYVEHSQRDADGEFEIEWTAPAPGTGPVTFYAAGNAVNGSGNAGDGADTTSLQLSEAQISSILAQVQVSLDLKLSPNPVRNRLTVKWENNGFQVERLNILNGVGQTILSQYIHPSQNFTEVQLSDQLTGMYFVQLSALEGVQTKKFLKL